MKNLKQWWNSESKVARFLNEENDEKLASNGDVVIGILSFVAFVGFLSIAHHIETAIG